MKKTTLLSFCLLLFLSASLSLFAHTKIEPDPAGRAPHHYVAPLVITDDVITVYPQSVPFWTGTTDSITKTDGDVNTVYPNVGWMVFDVSGIPDGSIINSVTFTGWVIDYSWPYWSITPMDSVDPIIGTAADIYNQVSKNWQQGTAYSYNTIGGITNGWWSREFEPQAFPDLQAALAQDWFAIGFVDWDFTPIYFVNFAGWNSTNVPYLEIDYAPVPVELISFTADVNENNVTLSWSTATETNNQGFEVQRSVSGGEYETITFVNGKGTTTEMQYYSYTDAGLTEGVYNYRLKQVDFDGTFEYSEAVMAEVVIPKVYSLSQNYPNPFNPSTTINYSIKEKGLVTLKVFDILGNEVKTLVNEVQEPGKYAIKFGSHSGESVNDGRNLASGIYFYTLQAGDFVSTKKMILLK